MYLCGDLAELPRFASALGLAHRGFVVVDLCQNVHTLDETWDWPHIESGRLPIEVHGLGVLYRRFFPEGVDYFTRISTEHAFQYLTESTKPGRAHRTGIYLTPVERVGEELRFRLFEVLDQPHRPHRELSRHRHPHRRCAQSRGGLALRGTKLR